MYYQQRHLLLSLALPRVLLLVCSRLPEILILDPVACHPSSSYYYEEGRSECEKRERGSILFWDMFQESHPFAIVASHSHSSLMPDVPCALTHSSTSLLLPPLPTSTSSFFLRINETEGQRMLFLHLSKVHTQGKGAKKFSSLSPPFTR